MSDKMRQKFDELFTNYGDGTETMREALYEVFCKGWKAGEGQALTSSQVASTPRIGYMITVIESEAGWGCKSDGYMVGFTVEDLEKRKIDFEKANSNTYGLYYERPNHYTPVELTEEAVQALLSATARHNTLWFDTLSQFKKGA